MIVSLARAVLSHIFSAPHFTRKSSTFPEVISYLTRAIRLENFLNSGPLTAEQKRQYLADIEETPARLRTALRGLSNEQLNTPYRDGGWTLRQVAHHLADSHMNSYIRFKLALTENEPTVKTYMENLWAELPEAKHAPVEVSLALLDALHQR